MEGIYDVIIIGAGPAGLSAAIYAQRARLKTLVLESAYFGGGQVLNTYEVDNYPGLPGISGMDMGMKFQEHAKAMGAEVVQAEVTEIFPEGDVKTITTAGGTYRTKSIIIATGARHSLLEVPGEKELAGMGVSYCATCDGAFFKNKTVAVVGGGDVAAEDAIFLARGCKKVYVVHRRDQLRAAKLLQDKLLSLDNVEMKWNSVVTEIQGDGQVERVVIQNVKDNQTESCELDGVFIAVGIKPNSEAFNGLVKMDDRGYIVAGEDGKTSVPGVFAAGDLRTKALRQIITAASDGANAVTAAQEYLLVL